MFQACFEELTGREFQKCSREVSRLFQGSFNEMSKVFQSRFEGVNRKSDMQKDDFCLGTGIWIWKSPYNLFGQICKINGYKSKYYGVSGKIY